MYKYKFRLDVVGSAIVRARALLHIAKAAGLNLANMFFKVLREKNQF